MALAVSYCIGAEYVAMNLFFAAIDFLFLIAIEKIYQADDVFSSGARIFPINIHTGPQS